jgi:MFS superfamily sulfate permease-like transporter
MPWIRTKRGKGSGARLSDGLQKPHRFASDFIAGLTGALVYIPQGIAYSLVAGVAPSFAL